MDLLLTFGAFMILPASNIVFFCFAPFVFHPSTAFDSGGAGHRLIIDTRNCRVGLALVDLVPSHSSTCHKVCTKLSIQAFSINMILSLSSNAIFTVAYEPLGQLNG